MNDEKAGVLSESVLAQIDQWLAKYPPEQRRSAVLPALLLVQKANAGWLSDELIEATAAYLGIPAISAYEVARFYSMYELAPIGKHKISVCTNISCRLAGCQSIIDHLQQRCQTQMGQTSADGRYTLRSVECMGACAHAPMLEVNEQYHERLTPAKVDAILAELEPEDA